jgi:type II secretory pathway pseudopilin PulG
LLALFRFLFLRRENEMRPNRAFTVIDLLVTSVLLGIALTAVVPLRAEKVRMTRSALANQNAQQIIQAVQRAYLKAGGASYSIRHLPTSAILRELGGKVPLNPCNGGRDLSDYSFIQGPKGVSVLAKPGIHCRASTMVPFKLGE